MKNLKSALAFILTIFILCSNSFAAEYTSEIADYTEAFEDYSLLAAIGITEEAEYEDIDFEKEISRADFAEMIVKALNCIPDDAGNIENIFSDVEFDNEKAPYIAEAYKRGLISGYGDGRFNPNDIIKENEAVKIVVCALGYEPIAEAKKGYYYGYNDIAQSLKLFPGASISSDKLVLKNACKLIYKMLITNTNEVTGISTGITYSPSGKPLLASEFGIYEVEGILNALNGANIYGIPNSSSTELEINRTKYHVENASEYIGLLGESVRAFVKEIKNERQKELVAVFRDGSKSVTIEADDIYDVTETSISYENSNSRKNIKVNSDSKVVYNGVYKAAFSNYNRADLKNADGEIKIIDSDKDGKYDTVMVWDYKYYVADSYSKSKNTIYIKNDMKFEGKTYIELGKNEEPYMCFMEGAPTAVKDIRDGDIISVARSANQSGDKLTTIYISRETINLTIDELKNNDTVVYKETDEFDETLVTEKEIKLATGYETATVEKIQVGESGTFKLNHRGEILVREKPKGTKTDKMHGYLAEIPYDRDSFDTKIGFKLLGSDNKWNTFEGAEKITLYATVGYGNVVEDTYKKEKYTELEAKLRDILTNSGSEKWHGGLVEYTVDADGKIKEIYASYDLSRQEGYIGIDEKNFSLDHSRPIGGSQDWSYASWITSKIRIGTGLVCYLVPNEITDTVRENDFSAVSFGSLGGGSDHWYDGYKIYDVREDDRFASYFIKEYKAGTTAGGAEAVSTANKDVMLVSEVVRKVKDDETGYSVNGYMRGKDFSFFVAEDEIDKITESQYTANQLNPSSPDYMQDVYYRGGMNVKQLGTGDVIQLSLNATNTVKNFRVLFDKSAELGTYSDKYFHIQSGNEGHINGEIDISRKYWNLYTCHGEVLSYDKKTGIAVIKSYIPENPPYEEKYYCKVYQLNREFTDVYLCDGDNVSKSNAVDINVGDQLFIRSYFNETQTVVVYR